MFRALCCYMLGRPKKSAKTCLRNLLIRVILPATRCRVQIQLSCFQWRRAGACLLQV